MVMYGYHMVAPPSNQTIAHRVRAAMDEADVSEAALALQTGLSRSTLRRRLAGTSDWMTSELTTISTTLGVPLLSLLADEVAA